MADKRTMAILAVVISATVYGMLGFPSRYFKDAGIGFLDTTMIRTAFSMVFLLIVMLIFSRDSFKISLKNIPIMLMVGVFKLLSDVTFFYAQGSITLCLSTLLQMTAPYYIVIISLYLFKEKITLAKLSAMVMGSIGCVFVTGVITGKLEVEAFGLISAIASGLFAAMYTIGSKVAFDRDMKTESILFYMLLIETIIALPFFDFSGTVEAVSNAEGIGMALFLSLVATLLPMYLYTWSLGYIEPTLTSMISVLEVVVAAIVGLFFFNENLGILNFFGMILVCLSVIAMSIKLHFDFKKRYGKYIAPALRKIEDVLERYETKGLLR